jgi:hypothetical protein
MSVSESAPAITLADDIIDIILSNLPYSTIYKLSLAGNAKYHSYLLSQGKELILCLEGWMHPAAEYNPISKDFDFTNLDLIIKHLWNMIICLKSVWVIEYSNSTSSTQSNMSISRNMLIDVYGYITMECDYPESYHDMTDDIWECIIITYLDSEYDETGNGWLGGYKKWKYICRAIENYPKQHELDTLAKQKHALTILILTYIEYKEEIMAMYENEYQRIDTDEKFYNELKSLIAVVSKNGHLGAEMISRQFVQDTFYFMNQ